MRNKIEPTQRKESREGLLSQGGFYIFIYWYWFTWAMLVFAVISFFLCLFQAPAWIVKVENGLGKLFPPSAMATVAELAGLPGVIFSGLLSRLGDRVCGVKMPDLIQAKYPRFFRLCFGSFIILCLVAALAGSNNLFWPTLYAFLGVLAAIGCICRVCYVFLIKSNRQEEFAFGYYREELMDSRTCLAGDMPDKAGAFQKGKSKDSNQDWRFRQTLINTAEYARTLLLQEHKDRLFEVGQMWMDVFSNQSMPEWDEDTYFAPDHYIFQDCSLAASAWAALLPNGLKAPLEVKILHSMMDCLDASVSNQNDNGRYVYHRGVLILGLAQFLMENAPRGDEQAIKQLCSLTYGRQEHPADQDLICACLMMRVVEWLENGPAAESDLACAIYLLQPLIDQSLLSTQGWTKKPPLAEFLYCAGSIIRHAHCMKLEDFFVYVQGKLERRTETYNMSVRLCRKVWSPELLSCLLQQISNRNAAPATTSRRESPVPMEEAPKEAAEEAAEEAVPEEASEEAAEEAAPEEASGEAAEEAVPEEASGEAAEEAVPEEASGEAAEGAVLGEALVASGKVPVQAAVGLDKAQKKEV